MTVVDPTFLTSGTEWSVGAGSAGEVAAAPGEFGSVLAEQVTKLGALQHDAADAARALATGTATDPSTAVVAVERARLAMQLAAQLRTKGVEAINDVMHTQV